MYKMTILPLFKECGMQSCVRFIYMNCSRSLKCFYCREKVATLSKDD